jgi:trigger factor
MQVTETLSSGLKRELSIVVPAAELNKRLDDRLAEMKDKVRINGFRPGKVPTSHLKRLAGRSEMAQIIDTVIQEAVRTTVEERKERPALNPDVKLADEAQIEQVIEGAADLVFSAAYELLPEFDVVDFTGIEVEKLVAEIPAEEAEQGLTQLAEQARPFADRDEGAAAEKGDRLTIDFVGKIDGEAFEGGSAEGAPLVLGSGQFIPGFEDQLVGAKAGDVVEVKVTFPAEYQAAHLAGKDAVFTVTVKAVAAPGELELTDEWAKGLGIESVDKIREMFREQVAARYNQASRAKLKRALLDKLDEAYSFELPEKLVASEFEQIWKQVESEMKEKNRTFADEETTEEEARAEYQRLAERRVRLGLVLAEMGEKAGVQVTDEELQRALFEMVRRYPANQQQEVYDFYRNNPAALTNLRAPLFEEKVVDYLLTQIAVTDQPVSKDELLADDEPAAAEAKPAKKPVKKAAKAETAEEAGEPKKKAAPRKKAAAKDEAE